MRFMRFVLARRHEILQTVRHETRSTTYSDLCGTARPYDANGSYPQPAATAACAAWNCCRALASEVASSRSMHERAP
jgi:hypothetical protein